MKTNKNKCFFVHFFLCRSDHRAEAAEGRPHSHTPPPAGHEDWPGSSSPGLLP